MNKIPKIMKRYKLKKMFTLRRTYRRMDVLTIPNCRVATLLKLNFLNIFSDNNSFSGNYYSNYSMDNYKYKKCP